MGLRGAALARPATYRSAIYFIAMRRQEQVKLERGNGYVIAIGVAES